MKDKHKRMKAKMVEERQKFDDEMAKIKNEFANSVNKHHSDMHNLKNKMESEMNVKTQELTGEYTNRVNSLESRLSDTQSKLENMQMTIKTDYILKESHTHIVSRSIEETDKKVKDYLSQNYEEKEENLNKIITELKKKLEKEADFNNNQN